MSNKLLLASLAALVSSTAVIAAPSDPVAPPGARPAPAPLPTCTAGGDVVFAIDHKSEAASPQWRFELQAKGMYTLSRLDKGKAVFASTGCLGTPSVSRILTAFAGATWKTTSGAACAAYSPDFVEYTVGGRVVFTDRMCNTSWLDAASRKALDSALAIVKSVDVPPAAPPSKLPAKP